MKKKITKPGRNEDKLKAYLEQMASMQGPHFDEVLKQFLVECKTHMRERAFAEHFEKEYGNGQKAN